MELGHRRAESNIDAVLAVHLGEESTDHRSTRSGTERRLQRGGSRLDNGDLAAVFAGCGRGLQPDPTGTHDDHPAAAPDGLAQPLRVINPAQVTDSVQVGTR